MMEVKSELRKGIKSATLYACLFFISFSIMLLLSWVIFKPYEIDAYESLVIGYLFGCSLGVMAGMDIICGSIKEYIKGDD